jgi:hypothetical protein
LNVVVAPLYELIDQLLMATAERIAWERVVDIERFVMLRLKYFERRGQAQLQRRQEAADAADRARATAVITTPLPSQPVANTRYQRRYAGGTVTGVW